MSESSSALLFAQRSHRVHRSTRSHVAQAQKALIRLIWRQKLRPGDHLPGQQILREQLGFSNNTLSPAMRELEDQGIVRRQPRVGTLVLDPARVPAGLWTIGLALPPFENPHASPYYAILAGYLQDRLARLGCHCRLYPHIHGTPLADMYDPVRNFMHLEADVEHGLIDGLITTYAIDGQVCWELQRKGVLIAQTSANAKGGPLHVSFDGINMVHQAVNLLVDRGCSRLALALSVNSRPEYFTGVNELICTFQSNNLSKSSRQIYRARSKGMWGGCEIAQDILNLNSKNRPDGLIIIDDYLAMGLTSTLASYPDYRPLFAVQTTRQSPLAFALPVMRFESDIELQATRLIESLIAGLRDPDSLPQSISLNAATDEQMRQVPKEDVSNDP